MKKHTTWLLILCWVIGAKAQTGQWPTDDWPQAIPQALKEQAQMMQVTGLNYASFEFDAHIKDCKKCQALREEFIHTLAQLNQLRDKTYQARVAEAAQAYEGLNIYHNFGSKTKNDEVNTCVAGWCLVLAETAQPKLKSLAFGRLEYKSATIAREKSKANPNLNQRKSKYIHVLDVLANAESLGFAPLDLDLCQCGDFAIQFYRSSKYDDFGFYPQHISLVDKIYRYGTQSFELRDWHEGIKNEPYLYRTGKNKSSSHNNIFLPENVYYGYQEDSGEERPLLGKNPNISQGYAYFGANLDAAKVLIEQLNMLRAALNDCCK